ncbi:MAG TPA: cytochrome P450 [Acidimicrobiales bacterium]|nr:cytochrome P450 [Acidimicrobiales bacterium]
MTTEATFDPFAAGFAASPYEQYRALRQQGPTHRMAAEVVLLTQHRACFELLRMPGTSVDERNATVDLGGPRPDDVVERHGDRGRHAILNLDPPDHTRLRRLVSSAFTVRRVEQLRPRVRALAAALLDDVAAAGGGGEPVDLIACYAFPLPFTVIHDLLGMPDGDRDQVRAWSHLIVRFLEPISTPDDLREAAVASDAMDAHIREAIAWKRRNPADDLLSALIAAEDDGDRLSVPELVDQVRLLYMAGHETTVNLIGNSTLALLRHREQFELLAGNPALDSPAVDELLRYDSPVQLSRRIALTKIELEDDTVGPGDLVVTLLGSANRDEAEWGPTADRLDLRREGTNAQLSFGSGIHHCLGAALARLQGSEALPALVRRFPRLAEADGVAWNGRVVLRGLDVLPVTLHG